MKKISCHAVLFLFLCAVAGQGSDVSARRIIQNVEKNLDSDRILMFAFEESYHWALTGEEHVLSGTIILGKGDRFRITTEDQIIVSDGETLWTYSKPDHRVLVDKAAVSGEALLPRQIFFRYTRDFSARLEGKVEIGDKKCYLLNLEADDKSVFVPFVRIWVDESSWLPVQIEQKDVGGNTSVYLIHPIRRDEKVPADAFRFKIPQGAEVIQMH